MKNAATFAVYALAALLLPFCGYGEEPPTNIYALEGTIELREQDEVHVAVRLNQWHGFGDYNYPLATTDHLFLISTTTIRGVRIENRLARDARGEFHTGSFEYQPELHSALDLDFTLEVRRQDSSESRITLAQVTAPHPFELHSPSKFDDVSRASDSLDIEWQPYGTADGAKYTLLGDFCVRRAIGMIPDSGSFQFVFAQEQEFFLALQGSCSFSLEFSLEKEGQLESHVGSGYIRSIRSQNVADLMVTP